MGNGTSGNPLAQIHESHHRGSSCGSQSAAHDLQSLGVHPNAASCDRENSDAEINQAIAVFQDGLGDWSYAGCKDLSIFIKKIREWAVDLWTDLVAEKGEEYPIVFFRFQREGGGRLGHYQPARNDSGLKLEIGINPKHLSAEPDIDLAETVIHELLHLYEDLWGNPPRSANNYHSAWFRRRARGLGIPCSRYGAGQGRIDPSPFVEWARQQGLDGIHTHGHLDEEAPSCRPPKRDPWDCGCPRGERVSVLVPRASVLAARCERCGEMFRKR